MTTFLIITGGALVVGILAYVRSEQRDQAKYDAHQRNLFNLKGED